MRDFIEAPVLLDVACPECGCQMHRKVINNHVVCYTSGCDNEEVEWRLPTVTLTRVNQDPDHG